MKRTSSSRSARRAAAAPRPVVAPLRISRTTLRRLGVLAIWGTVFTGAAYGLYVLEPISRGLLSNGTPTLRWVELPPWLTDQKLADVLSDIEAATGLSPKASIHDPDLCTRVAEGLRACPWVDSVQRVTK